MEIIDATKLSITQMVLAKQDIEDKHQEVEEFLDVLDTLSNKIFNCSLQEVLELFETLEENRSILTKEIEETINKLEK
jgi:hypothetical protein